MSAARNSVRLTHRERADWQAFDRLMTRSNGEPPRPGDELPVR
jgi:hypothetical protein